MKKSYKYISGMLVFLLLAIACTKEITEDLLVFFKVEVSKTGAIQTFVNTSDDIQFNITGIDGIQAGDYMFKYEVIEGTGSYTINSEEIPEDEFIDFPSGSISVSYTGTTVGTHKVLITIRNIQQREEQIELTYNVQDTAFTYQIEPQEGSAYIGEVKELTQNTTQVSPDTYETRYSFVVADENTGTAKVLINGEDAAPDTLVDTPAGNFVWQFEGLTLGRVQILFTTESKTFGIIREATVTLQVTDTPDFEFSVFRTSAPPITGVPNSLGFSIEETAGSSTYTMTYTTSSEGSLLYNGTSYQPGQEIPFVLDEITGQYTGTVAATHELVFTVSNANQTPVVRTAMINFVIQDPDVTAPVIVLVDEDKNPLIVQQGNALVDPGATATDDRDSVVEVIASNNVDVNVPGEYTITYTATDAAQNTASITRTVIVNAPPVAVISASPLSGLAPLSTSFNNSGSTDSDGSIVSSSWDFGDGEGTSGVFPLATTHEYAAGNYTAILTVTDNLGGVGTATVQIESINPDSTAPVITLNSPAQNPQIIQLGGTYTELGATALDDVDGTVTATPSGTVNTSVAGSYIITYTARDAANNTATATRTVIVNAPPVARITTNTTSGPAPLTVSFNNSGSTDPDDAIQNSTWNFGNGNNTGGFPNNRSFTFNSAGTYDVTMTVRDGRGGEDTATVRITVTNPPDTTPPVITIQGFTNVTIEVGTNYVDAGATATDNRDGNITSRIQTTSNVNTNIAGVYTVRYNVSDNAGNAAQEKVRTVRVQCVCDPGFVPCPDLPFCECVPEGQIDRCLL
ncbi:immunoglobulin-like domain-containing protein [Aquimarina sp. MMG016]|uniref:immunoglobulin-like domain-containing protein n=1 Tax=Aquimarina sp. MMG016 TaxID=2822690 RepID=UPI001B39F61A|nr:immunoglobulin-like domain-containing protein [Aquimarina sp. MMG016]MBQ4821929.1 DUF5011 domain-containing protein [Aquimarina sp. MMG016]